MPFESLDVRLQEVERVLSRVPALSAGRRIATFMLEDSGTAALSAVKREVDPSVRAFPVYYGAPDYFRLVIVDCVSWMATRKPPRAIRAHPGIQGIDRVKQFVGGCAHL